MNRAMERPRLTANTFAKCQSAFSPRPTGLGLALLTWIALVSDSYVDALGYSEQALSVAVTPFDRVTAQNGKGCALVLLRRTEEGMNVLRRKSRPSISIKSNAQSVAA